MVLQRIGQNWAAKHTCTHFKHCWYYRVNSVKFLLLCCCSVAQSCLSLCSSMDCSTSGFPALCNHPEFAQTPVCWLSEAIQPRHPLSSPSPPAFNLCQHQDLFQWVNSSHQVTNVLGLQRQSSQWLLRVDFLTVQGALESSPTLQFESISSLVLSLLYGPTVTSIHDYWKNHSFD